MKMLRMMSEKTIRDGKSNRTIHDTTGVEKTEEFTRAQIKMVWDAEKIGNERTLVKANPRKDEKKL